MASKPRTIGKSGVPGPNDPMRAAMKAAHAVGLHGVLILSPVCKTCGKMHDFSLYSDLEDPADLEDLLAEWATTVTEVEGTFVKGEGPLQ